MRARNLALVLSLAFAASLLVAPAPTLAATYLWQNSGGGDWDQPANWGSSSYPRFFFDFAIFNVDASYAIDATDPARVTPVGIVLVDDGELTLRTHDGFGGVLAVGNGPLPAVLRLLEGCVSAPGAHTVGPNGTLVLGEGTRLRSTVSGSTGLSILAGGRLEGTGSAMEGKVCRNAGTIAPGEAPGSTGVLSLGAESPAGLVLLPSSVFEIDLGGDAPGSGHDQLRLVNASAPLRLDGVLRVKVTAGFDPGIETRCAVVVAPAIEGAFSSIEFPEVAGVSFSVEMLPDRVEVIARGNTMLEACFAIQPGSEFGSLGLGKRGTLPAAIFDTDAVPAALVDAASVTLAGVPAERWGLEDVGGASCAGADDDAPDGREDLTLKFDALAILEAIGGGAHGDTVSLALEGLLVDGSSFTGEGRVVLRGKGGGRTKAAPEASGGIAAWVEGPARASVRTLVTVAPAAGPMTVRLFDVAGRLVGAVDAGVVAAGEQRLDWDVRGLASGVYFYRVTLGTGAVTAKMTLVR